MAKKVINGQAVIYTNNGVEIVPAEVRRYYNANRDDLKIKPDLPKGTRYILIGGAKTFQDQVGNIHAVDPMPFMIERAYKYAKSKFFHLILDLMKLAQFDPVYFSENCFGYQYFLHLKNPHQPIDCDINFDVSIKEIDAQFYKKYNFSQAMINFVERRYSYDDG